MNENIDNIINKFVKYKITIDELEEISQLISTENFKSQYAFVEDLQTVFREEGKVDLITELRQIIEDEKNKDGKSMVVMLKDYAVHAVAASILIACTIGVVKSTTGYNDVKNFRKTYIEKS